MGRGQSTDQRAISRSWLLSIREAGTKGLFVSGQDGAVPLLASAKVWARAGADRLCGLSPYGAANWCPVPSIRQMRYDNGRHASRNSVGDIPQPSKKSEPARSG